MVVLPIAAMVITYHVIRRRQDRDDRFEAFLMTFLIGMLIALALLAIGSIATGVWSRL